MNALLFLVVTFCLAQGEAASILESLSHADNVVDYISTAYETIYHMEEDEYIPGNILFTDSNSLKTTDGNTTTVIAGNAAVKGYIEGIREESRFAALTGFVQISPNEVIVADAVNHCLRLVDRSTGETQPFVGTCGKEGHTDGATAQFNMPWSIIKDNQVPDHLLVIDRINGLVRSVLVNDRLVSTYASVMDKPKNLLQLDNGDLIITSDHAVSRLDYSLHNLTLLAGTSETYGSDDGDFSSTRFFHPAAVIKLSDSKLMIADKANGKLRVMDLKTRQTTTFCTGMPAKCDFYDPRSLLLDGDELLVGEQGKIIRIDRDLTGKKQLVLIAEYDVECSSISDAMSQSSLQSVSNNNYRQIEEICQTDCKRPTGAEPLISCRAKTLTIKWPTDVEFKGDIPADIQKKLSERLSAKGSMLQIFLMHRIPPVVYPRLNKDGAYANVGTMNIGPDVY